MFVMNRATKFVIVVLFFSTIFVAEKASCKLRVRTSLANQGKANNHGTNNDPSSKQRSNNRRASGLMKRHRRNRDSLAPSRKYPSFASTLGGCGASLIHEDIVLSAANCSSVFKKGDRIYIDGVKINGADAEKIIVDYDVVHPDYDNRTTKNDLMIIKLSSPSTRPVQELNFDSSNPRVNDPLTTVGYGTLGSGIPYSGNLRDVTVFSVNNNECARIYRTAGYVYSQDTMICARARGGRKDSCQGDSGGPLYDSSLRQVGIVSHGEGCGLAAFPAVYTRISNYEVWIKQMICEHSSHPPSDCSSTSLNSTPSPSVVSSFTPSPTLSASLYSL